MVAGSELWDELGQDGMAKKSEKCVNKRGHLNHLQGLLG
jgi:hypothetical protein